MKILITGAKTATALKLIKAFGQYEVLLGDYGDLPNITTNTYSFVELGDWKADVLAHNLLTKCLDYQVDVLLPIYASEVVALVKSIVLFEEFGIKVLLPDELELKPIDAKDWAVFDQGQLIFSTLEVAPDRDKQTQLNGAYQMSFDGKLYATIAIDDPS